MIENTIEHKLKAILCADVQGYSHTMGDNEVGTNQALTVNLDTIRSNISGHIGQLIGENIQNNRLSKTPHPSILAALALMAVAAIRIAKYA